MIDFSRTRRVILAGAVVAAAMSAAQTSASATAFCAVKETSDGFVALRVAPDRNAATLARMKGGDEVMLRAGRRGVWQEVLYWPGGTRTAQPAASNGRRGWVHAQLIDICG
ncbi:SH3 domain-containing protein [Phreatobacter stygius]|uniref:SH3 domain-containing protein n=1 Tax=Phreatobacter stygius TaxID=1940610 RepID=A0A4D7BD22_9HYPH|nr:SH3 domain-containing protein [Phreatobacter stygius]QCI68750.1 SH3 domain-containing protein [Phreatobacter stygius]